MHGQAPDRVSASGFEMDVFRGTCVSVKLGNRDVAASRHSSVALMAFSLQISPERFALSGQIEAGFSCASWSQLIARRKAPGPQAGPGATQHPTGSPGES